MMLYNPDEAENPFEWNGFSSNANKRQALFNFFNKLAHEVVRSQYPAVTMQEVIYTSLFLQNIYITVLQLHSTYFY
jgi:hypothetical protein